MTTSLLLTLSTVFILYYGHPAFAASAGVSSSSISNTFTYNCTEDGDIMIIKDSSMTDANLLRLDTSDCDAAMDNGTFFWLSKCSKDTTIEIMIEKENVSDIFGGKNSEFFNIKCDDLNIKPYSVVATVTEKVANKATPVIVSMVTQSTAAPVTSLTMVIRDNGNTVTEAVLGQELEIDIGIPGDNQIKPILCTAEGNEKNTTLWEEDSCKHDEELFGANWTIDNKTVKNTLYGFRFVGPTNTVTLKCIVRVCPPGYSGTACDLDCKVHRARKRSRHSSNDVTMQVAETSFSIKESTSGADKSVVALASITGLMAAVMAVINTW